MNKHSFEKLEEKLGNEKTMISKAQLVSAISDVVTTTLVATVPIGTSIQACEIAAAETKRVLDDFFLAGEPEKKNGGCSRYGERCEVRGSEKSPVQPRC